MCLQLIIPAEPTVAFLTGEARGLLVADSHVLLETRVAYKPFRAEMTCVFPYAGVKIEMNFESMSCSKMLATLRTGVLHFSALQQVASFYKSFLFKQLNLSFRRTFNGWGRLMLGFYPCSIAQCSAKEHKG